MSDQPAKAMTAGYEVIRVFRLEASVTDGTEPVVSRSTATMRHEK